MNLIVLTISLIILGCGLAGAGIYAWNGNWMPTLLLLFSSTVGGILFAIIEVLLIPISLIVQYFSNKGRLILAIIFVTLNIFIIRAAFAVYCIATTIYLHLTPGAPSWATVSLMTLVACAPFAWAVQRGPDDASASGDLFASALGTLMAGTLLELGFRKEYALLAILAFFVLDMIFIVILWALVQVPKIRYNSLVKQLIESTK